MITRLKVILDPAEFDALYTVARAELRNPETQARYMLRQELTRRGLLPEEQARTAEPQGSGENES